ncbi:hypothetical protein CFOL_v3_14204 [Cephalotus follicularis]|uniref:Protein XRI1 n=1 Tax=Cephalotus follicularis TaxID=3775 RepID=A0A1Q3BRT3_CEPFO|nr:hypothetical protein CFOL_v3_14204 [Cephalotus follicularis]
MNYNNDQREPWGWQADDYGLQKNSNINMSECPWNDVTLNEEDLSYMFDDDATPVKDCGDLAYHVAHSGNMNKEPEETRVTSSQAKRRRMLDFNTQEIDFSLCSEAMSSAFLKSNEREESLEEVLPEASQWDPGVSEDAASSYEGLQTSEKWIAECFNDTDMPISPDDMTLSGASDIQIDISGRDECHFCNVTPEVEANTVQQHIPRTPRNIIFKGRKSFIRTPTKSPSSVAYPFAFVKPCTFHGDVTLKDINQKILTPPPSKSKESDEDPTAGYPTSAFSGKPVVGKTKIRTEGGKGSITIMRTKG